VQQSAGRILRVYHITTISFAGLNAFIKTRSFLLSVWRANFAHTGYLLAIPPIYVNVLSEKRSTISIIYSEITSSEDKDELSG
jgi:hypothetical protein